MLQTRFAVAVDRLGKAFDIVCKAVLVESNLYSQYIAIGEKEKISTCHYKVD